MKSFLSRLVREESGQDLIEYAFLAVFIALVVIGGITVLGNNINTQMSNIASQVSSGS